MELAGQVETRELELQAARQARRLEQRKSFPENALLWAALGPGWTATLARSAGFPVGTSDVSSVLERMAREGFTSKYALPTELAIDPESGLPTVTTPEDLYASGEQAIWETIENSTNPADRVQRVNECIANIARGLRQVEATGSALPDRILKWLELAERSGWVYDAKHYLLERVDEELERNNEPGAVAWIESAFPLERALGSQIALAVRLGGLRVQLHQRRTANEQQLKLFLQRAQQIEAFEQLLAGPDTRWALHYAGAGGVGKTTLVRYLESRAAPAAGAATARVDFDYLNPEYPRTKPALLLTQVAEELRLADKTGQASGYFESFFDKAQTLHERIAGQTTAGGGAPEEDPQFIDLLNMFADAVSTVAGRVVLILDTCEELAKMRADGSPQAAVEVTFAILARLHDLVPSLRVVFCGRRPLGSSGAGGWKCIRPGDLQLPARSFLSLHEIRAFSDDEAARYLHDVRECPANLVKHVLRHCVERGYTPLFSGSTGGAEPRYNPFELSLYANWISRTDGLTEEEVKNTSLDQFVRSRIVGRIDNRELASLLPVIAWAAAVDDQALSHFTGAVAGDAHVANLLAELRNQEWAQSAYGTAFVIQPAMRRRLLDYYSAHEPAAFHGARNAAAGYLERSLAQKPLKEIRVDHLEAVIEALQPEPARAAKWWQEFDERILKENAWDWILVPALRLLAEEHWPKNVLSGPHVRALVLATRVAAQIHTGDLTGAQESSRLMEADARAHPDAEEGRRLQWIARAVRGEISEFGPGDEVEELGAALLTGAEWLVETAPLSALAHPAATFDRWVEFTRNSIISLEQKAWMRALAGRLAQSQGEDSRAAAYFQNAFGMSAFFEGQPERQRWRFWVAPADLCSRLRLEFIHWAWPFSVGPAELVWWLRPPTVSDIDSDRLASGVLEIESALRVPQFGDDLQEMLANSKKQFYSNPLLLSVHFRFAPFFARAAEELAWQGNVERALEEVESQAAASEALGANFAETLAADRAAARIRMRMRLGDRGYGVESLEHSEDPADRAALFAYRSLSGHPMVFGDEDMRSAENRHIRWSSAIAVDSQAADRLLSWAIKAFETVIEFATPFEEASCALDVIEIQKLADRYGLSGMQMPLVTSANFSSAHPEEEFILALRKWALGLQASMPKRNLVERIGVRRAASIALDIGELLALKIPNASTPMLRFAQSGFRKAGDFDQEGLASICLCLALARAGEWAKIDKHLRRIRGLCKGRSSNGLFNAAGWSYAEAIVETGARPANFGTSDWREPWHLRLALVMALSKDSGSPGSYCANVMKAWYRIASGVVPAEALVGEARARAANDFPGRVGDFASALPKLMTIECLDRSLQPVSGLRIRLSSGGHVMEIITPSPTAPYLGIERINGIDWFRDSKTLSIDRTAAWVSWEAILDPQGTEMYSRRILDAEPPVPNLMNWVSPSFHTLTHDHEGANLGGSAFGSTKRWIYSYDTESITKQFTKQFGESPSIQVLHVVSDVLNTSSGARLSFRSEADSRGRLFRAEEMTRILPDIRLFVLQLPVGLNDGRRDGVCRDKAACLRSFAAQLQLASRQIVITLPGLRFKDGTFILECIARGVMDPTPTAAWAIFRELTAARATLFQDLPPEENEACFDICYFG